MNTTPPIYPAHIWVGNLVGDEVRGRRFLVNSIKESSQLHWKHGFGGGLHWRMRSGGDTVFWWEAPTGMEADLVRAWLEGKGEKPTRVVHTHWVKEVAEMEAAVERSGNSIPCAPWVETFAGHH